MVSDERPTQRPRPPRTADACGRLRPGPRGAIVIDRSGALEKIAEKRNEMRQGRGAGGRPPTISDRTVLTLMFLLASEHSPMHLTVATDMVRNRMRDDSLRYLDLSGFKGLSHERVYHRLARALQRLIEPYDPFKGPRGKRLTFGEFEELRRSRDESDVSRQNEVLHEIVNDLVISSVKTYGAEVLSHLEGNYAVDGTLVRSGGRRGTDHKNGKYVATDYDAGRYYRDSEDHTGSDLPGAKRRTAKNWWGYELTQVVTVSNQKPGREYIPNLTVGVAFDGAARDPGRNAVRAFRTVSRHGLPVNLAIADRAFYAGAKVENFHEQMTAMGFKPVTDYKSDQLGVQDNYRGALLVEGWWYCASMPSGLVNATKEFRAGRTTLEEYMRHIETRKKYAATRKDRPDGNGTTRWAHPEHVGHHCKGKDLFCTQKSLSIPLKAGQKYAQEFPFQSPEWKTAYSMRNSVEAANAEVKRASTHNLGDPERRRLRGRTSQFLLAALVLMARNIERLQEFRRRTVDLSHAEKIARKKANRARRPFNNSTEDDDKREGVAPERLARI